MKTRNVGLTMYWFFVGLYLAMAVGWALNIVDIVQTVGGDITALLIVRLVGLVVFPLGSILGWVS